MSIYTTGELAKKCHVTVRTIQYYDQKGLLSPSSLSDGGRRIYTEDDLKKMKLICFLKGLGFSLDNIKEILYDAHNEQIVSTLIYTRRSIIESEISALQNNLKQLDELNLYLNEFNRFSCETIKDIAQVMENETKLKKLHLLMNLSGIIQVIIMLLLMILSIINKNIIYVIIGILLAIIISSYTLHKIYKHTSLICPICNKVYKPNFKEFVWAAHTPQLRNCTCTFCQEKNYGIITFDDRDSMTK